MANFYCKCCGQKYSDVRSHGFYNGQMINIKKRMFTTNIDGKFGLDNFLNVLTNTEELVAATALKC